MVARVIRLSPKGVRWTLLRSFTGAGRYVVAVVRSESGSIWNMSLETFETWPEVTE